MDGWLNQTAEHKLGEQSPELELRVLRTWLALAAVVQAAGCRNEAPALLELARDSLVLYGQEQTQLPLRLVDANGEVRVPIEARVTEAGDLLQIRGTWVACRKDGSTSLHIAVRRMVDTMIVWCRTARQVHVEPFLLIDLPDSSRVLSASVLVDSPRLERIGPLQLVMSDSTVVAMRGDTIIPLSVGRTTMHIDLGGVRARMTVEVHHLVANGLVELRGGKSSRWELPAGRYQITVKVPSPSELALLAMDTEGAQCSRDRRDEDSIHCVVYDRASVSMRNSSSDPTEIRRASIQIKRLP